MFASLLAAPMSTDASQLASSKNVEEIIDSNVVPDNVILGYRSRTLPRSLSTKRQPGVL